MPEIDSDTRAAQNDLDSLDVAKIINNIISPRYFGLHAISKTFAAAGAHVFFRGHFIREQRALKDMRV